ncbi:MAG: hypothetical protein K8R23_20205 [Chthoniobacter sp.]|nr:hypothetical protein [Chthoniobacter sp.]
MKFFLLIGGFCGFALTFAASLHAENEVSFALRDGAMGCLGGALILRGFHFVVLQTIRDHISQLAVRARVQAEAAAVQQNS